MPNQTLNRLPGAFYQRDTEIVARELLGQRLVHIVDGQRLSGLIVETEAYLGVRDRACHAFGDRRTPRTESLYLAGGHAYVYFIYGMHFCFNVVTRKAGEPEAVLVRAIEPIDGRDLMRSRRPSARREIDLTNGPGKLCAAMGIARPCDRLSLAGPELFIEQGDRTFTDSEIVRTPRIGVAYALEAAGWPLRFNIRGNPYVSKVSNPLAVPISSSSSH